MINVALLGGSSSVQKLLNEVAAALPQQVQRFVMEKVCFIVVGSAHGHGQTWNRRYLRPAQAWGDDPEPAEWVITLSQDGITPQIVAHEVAHAFEAHNGDGSDVEAEADKLASEWESSRNESHDD